ncbi:hypothetical protein [Noviherbaspirillum pedocola]|uniref:Uncharacterized protein n=1 Tax=Noviherbaspirillum pedocola TaxID=2801341 RepID=A0A934SUR1_9BURK|nr:hypothetical protein [Noviherbaspirillum pedocola]MBK4735531.1 hypothetical protein [Noviherbaspirillum pedocola]
MKIFTEDEVNVLFDLLVAEVENSRTEYKSVSVSDYYKETKIIEIQTERSWLLSSLHNRDVCCLACSLLAYPSAFAKMLDMIPDDDETVADLTYAVESGRDFADGDAWFKTVYVESARHFETWLARRAVSRVLRNARR